MPLMLYAVESFDTHCYQYVANISADSFTPQKTYILSAPYRSIHLIQDAERLSLQSYQQKDTAIQYEASIDDLHEAVLGHSHTHKTLDTRS